MLKKSTLLFVSIFVLLFIGVSDYGYAHHKPGHSGGPGGGGDPDPLPEGQCSFDFSVVFDDDTILTIAGSSQAGNGWDLVKNHTDMYAIRWKPVKD